MKLAHILLVVWQNGYSEMLTDNYEHCWEMDGLIRQEIEYHTPEGAGDLLMTRCEPTQIITAVGFPQLRAVDALELADNNLTNLQPKIANGLVRSDWVPVFDGYIDPVIQAARAALTQKDTVHD